MSHTWTLSEVLYELSVHGIIYSVRRKISVCEADIYFHLTLYRQNEGAVEDSAGCAKRGFAGRGNSRKLETGRPAVGGTLIHVIGACPVIKTAEAGDRRME